MTFSYLRFIIESDILLACLLPVAILIVGYNHFPYFSISEIRELLTLGPKRLPSNSNFSLERAYFAFCQYARLSARELTLMRASYASSARSSKNLGFKIAYPKKLDRLEEVTHLNTTIADGIALLALDEFPGLKDESGIPVDSGDLSRVRESLKHFVRDWSEEGAEERTKIFQPILDYLKEVNVNERANLKVLVPGCGLGRLAWEISQLGFDTTANELSYFMILAFRFLLSPETTKTPNEHYLRPYAHWFSHQRSNDLLFRRIAFPDVVPRLNPKFQLAEQDFLKLAPPCNSYSSLPTKSFNWSRDTLTKSNKFLDGYDYIVTLFFIDTSLDVLTTMNHIHNLLLPGGVWINLGPLFWTGSAQAKLELSLEEVLHAAKEIGFFIESEQTGSAARKTVECEYTGDKSAMMRWIYKAEFWVARKLK